MLKKPLLLLAAGLLAFGNAYAEDEEPEKEFSLDGEVGLLFTTGNTETSSFKGRLASHHEMESWSNDYVLEMLYKREEVDTEEGEQTQTSAQKIFFSGQGNYKLTNPDNRLFLFGSYEDDRFSGFEYQSTIAAGWNSKLWKNKNSRLAYSVGPGYAIARTMEGESRNGVIVRGAFDYKWKVSDSATFKQIVSTEVGSENTKSRSETSISAQVNGSMSLKFSIILNHNSNVEVGTEKLDTETTATLVYSFF
ncbi:DUF481 domain-containing protein [Alteromonas sp. a30]|uniref:DUF481 domain-containing protein n=1 Tax=Alteromonas sp. a30 TaxID=2730917 RepID=UPI00227DDF5D|nr:DUF481 domain-containing protein [Alteromonas sp. a30]MCY7296099.1 DUF481 domain-containing protein [Alteromonas sp. a30]